MQYNLKCVVRGSEGAVLLDASGQQQEYEYDPDPGAVSLCDDCGRSGPLFVVSGAWGGAFPRSLCPVCLPQEGEAYTWEDGKDEIGEDEIDARVHAWRRLIG